MRLRKLGGNVEFKFSAILNLLISNLDCPHVTLLLNLFSHEWLNNWIELLIGILKNDWVAKRNTVLKMSCLNFDFHGWLDDCIFCFLLHLFDPSISLHLWINHKWPSFRVIHDDSIIYGKVFLRKLLDEPSLDLHTTSKNFLETEWTCALNFE